jgi:hypothetical protein
VLFFYTGFVPELAKEMHLAGDLRINRASIVIFSGMAVGDLLIAGLSLRLQSRKRPILWFLALSAVFQTSLLFCRGATDLQIYSIVFLLGVTSGNALYVALIAEQFGTNLRDTAATTVTNLIRFSVVPLGLLVSAGQARTASLGASGFLISLGCLAVGVLALSRLRETFGARVDYLET